MKIKQVTRKSMDIRESGRSSDYISPSFGHGCLFNCSYCYMKRHKPSGLTIAKNIGDILTSINNHVYFYAQVPKPNQTHEEFITYDISCNEDFALHANNYNWEYIFDFFKNHPKAMATFATKTVPYKFLKYNPEGKVRIRFSLMPEKIRKVLEPSTAPIEKRIEAIDKFIDAGYDVHLNFSPVVVYDNWLTDYKELFETLNKNVSQKQNVKAEVIFLTHNKKKHLYNLENNIPGEDLIWRPDLQQDKISIYGGENVRYNHILKSGYIREWTSLHDDIIPWNTIRYIF